MFKCKWSKLFTNYLFSLLTFTRRCINDSDSTTRKWTELPTLFFKFAGTTSGIKEQISIVKRLAKKSQNKTFEFAKDADEADELWSARKAALFSIMAMRRNQDDHVWTTDVAVPISRLPDIIKETKEDMTSSGLLGGIVGHVGDGNFHTILLFNEAERKTAEDVVHRKTVTSFWHIYVDQPDFLADLFSIGMVRRAIELEGTATGEHGVGLIKRDALVHELGQTTVDAMRRLKQAFDPLCLLNCDKVVRMEAMQKGEVEAW